MIIINFIINNILSYNKVSLLNFSIASIYTKHIYLYFLRYILSKNLLFWELIFPIAFKRSVLFLILYYINLLGAEVTVIMKAVPPGRGSAIALRWNWPLRSPSSGESSAQFLIVGTAGIRVPYIKWKKTLLYFSIERSSSSHLKRHMQNN